MLRVASPLPGFGLGMGILLAALTGVVLLPLAALLGQGLLMGPAEIAGHLAPARVRAALLLSFRAALVASLFNLVFGLALAWVLTRYRFPGRRILYIPLIFPYLDSSRFTSSQKSSSSDTQSPIALAVRAFGLWNVACSHTMQTAVTGLGFGNVSIGNAATH